MENFNPNPEPGVQPPAASHSKGWWVKTLLLLPLASGLLLALVGSFFPNYSSCGFFAIGPCGELGGFPFPYFSLTELNPAWLAIGFVVNAVFYIAVAFAVALLALVLSKFVMGLKSFLLAGVVMLLPAVTAVFLWLVTMFIVPPTWLRDVVFVIGGIDIVIAEKMGLTQIQYLVSIETYILLIAALISIYGLLGVYYLFRLVKDKINVPGWTLGILFVIAICYPLLRFIPHPSLTVYNAPSNEVLPFTVISINRTTDQLRVKLDFKSLPEENKIYTTRVCAVNSLESLDFSSTGTCTNANASLRSVNGKIERSAGEYITEDEYYPISIVGANIQSNLTGKEKKLIVFLEPLSRDSGIVYGVRHYEVDLSNYAVSDDIGIPDLAPDTGWKQFNHMDGYSFIAPESYVLYSKIDRSSTEPWVMGVYEGSFRVNVGVSESQVTETASPQVRISILAADESPESVLQNYVIDNGYDDSNLTVKKLLYNGSEAYQLLGDGTINSPHLVTLIPHDDKYFIVQQDTTDPVLTRIAGSFTIYK
ncbi:MAG TPA: hypothetical protein PKD34_01845 [Candidatus Doudnabacteria bacterium]|nr:hypothetical protein [Candidatus Doudnabacteria bacterium]